MKRIAAALALVLSSLSSFGQSPVAPNVAMAGGSPRIPDVRMVPKIICVGEWRLQKGEKKDNDLLSPARFYLSHGSGLTISPDGLILTNRHVVSDCTAVLIQLPGSRRLLPATAAYRDRDDDVAFVVADTQNLPAYDLSTAADAQPGQAIVVEGYPIEINQGDPAITTGVVSRWSERPNGRRWLQMSAAISGGNSGGPVFDEAGRLLGITVATLTRGQNLNFAVPAGSVLQAYNDMKIGNDVARARAYLASPAAIKRHEYAQSVYGAEVEGGETAQGRVDQLIKQGSPDALIYGAGQLYDSSTRAFGTGDKPKAWRYLVLATDYASRAVDIDADYKRDEFTSVLLSIRQQLAEAQKASESEKEAKAPEPPPAAAPAAGPSAPPVATPTRTAGPDVAGSGNPAPMLRLHGSNTVGAELAPVLAREFLRAQGATDVRQVPGSRPNELMVVGQAGGRPLAIEIFSHGTATAFTDLGAGTADIGMASRAIKDDEARRLNVLGDLRAFENEHVIGLDGIAVIVHASNRLADISTHDVARIFSGEVTDWSQLAPGMRGPIHLHARDKNSGTMDTFKALVLGERKLSPGATVYESNEALSDAVSADEGSIGFVSLPAIRRARAVPVSAGAAAMFPTVFSIRTEDYPLKRRLYLYTSVANGKVRDFIDFAYSREGQRIVESVGFVGQIPDEMPTDAREVTPRYRSMTSGKRRLSINFRFRSGNFELENKSRRDLDELVRKLSEPDFRKAELHLYGFADNVGARDGNCRLSEKRAQSIADALRRYGLAASTAGFCDDMPVAPNDTEDGRQSNRRVEVWIRRR